jgi:hypothetical protein
MKFTMAAVAFVLFTGSAMSQQPYAGLQERTIKTLSDQQIADLNAGRGMGLALAAELNGYPGPFHAIELAGQLHLSSDQINKLKQLFEAMKAETISIGATLIAQERNLNDDFAKRTVTLARLEAATQNIGTTQAALRAAQNITCQPLISLVPSKWRDTTNCVVTNPERSQRTATISINGPPSRCDLFADRIDALCAVYRC